MMPLLNNNDYEEPPEQQFRRQSAIARQSCDLGRKFLSDNDYQNAAKEFSKAVMTFEYILKNNVKQASTLKDELAVLMKEVIRPSYSNLSLCYLKLQKWDLVLTFTQQIINEDPSNIKNLYRRGVARKASKMFDEAIEDFQKVVSLDPQMQAECTRLINDCKQGKREQKEKQKKLAKNLISNYSQDKPEPKKPDIPKQVEEKKADTGDGQRKDLSR